MTGGKGTFLSAPCARGGRAAKNPLHPRQADPISEPGASREGEALLPARLRACPGLPRPGPHRPLRVNSAGGKRRRSARAGCWTLSRARARCLRQELTCANIGICFSRPVIALPQPGAVVGFATCNTCDWRGECRQRGGHFCRPLAREGGRPTKFPRSRRYSRSRGGQGRRQVGRAAGASREVVWGRPGAVARSGRRRQAGLSWERVRACWGQARMCNRSIRNEQAMSIGAIEEGAGIWSAFRLPD